MSVAILVLCNSVQFWLVFVFDISCFYRLNLLFFLTIQSYALKTVEKTFENVFFVSISPSLSLSISVSRIKTGMGKLLWSDRHLKINKIEKKERRK